MSKLTFTIGGREALPVRAIPYVTGWQMSPDVVARSMAKVEPPPPFPALLSGLQAYHLPDDAAVEMLPREWDAVVANLEGYEAELKKQHPDDAIGYAAWRKDSASKLPAGVFVWLDEFASERTADRAKVLTGKERRGDDELILAPVLALTISRLPLSPSSFSMKASSANQLRRSPAPPPTSTPRNSLSRERCVAKNWRFGFDVDFAFQA